MGAFNVLGALDISDALSALSALDMAIKDINTGLTANGSNNDINNEVNTGALGTLGATIKD